MRLAKSIGCSVQRAKAETSISEFIDWMIFEEEEVNAFRPLFWYLAMLAKHVYDLPSRFWTGKPSELKVKDFLMEFKAEDPGKRPEEMTESERLAHMQQSKAAWGTLAAGLKRAATEAAKEKEKRKKVEAAKSGKLPPRKVPKGRRVNGR